MTRGRKCGRGRRPCFRDLICFFFAEEGRELRMSPVKPNGIYNACFSKDNLSTRLNKLYTQTLLQHLTNFIDISQVHLGFHIVHHTFAMDNFSSTDWDQNALASFVFLTNSIVPHWDLESSLWFFLKIFLMFFSSQQLVNIVTEQTKFTKKIKVNL